MSQNRNPELEVDTAVVLMGEYLVINKRNSKIKTIESPAIQSCLLVIIESAASIAVAHIDTHQTAIKVIHEMIREMGNDEISSFKATLIGGDVSILNQGSEKMRKAVIGALDIYDINYTHKECSYYIPDIILPGVYLSLRFADMVGPSSYLYTFLNATVLFGLNYSMNYFLGNTYDAKIDVMTGESKVVKNDTMNSERIYKMVTLEQKERFFNRTHLNPKFSKKNTLEMAKHPNSI